MASIVQRGSNEAFGTAVSVTGLTAVTSGNTVVVGVALDDTNAANITSVTDNGSPGTNTYSLDATLTEKDIQGAVNMRYYRCHNVTNGPTSVTVNAGSSIFPVVCVWEVNGINDAAPTYSDDVNDTDDGGQATSATLPLTANSGDVMLGFIRVPGEGNNISAEDTETWSQTTTWAGTLDQVAGADTDLGASWTATTDFIIYGAVYAQTTSGGALPLINPYGSGLIST